MKIILYILILFTVSPGLLVAQNKYPVSWEYKGLTFEEFKSESEARFNIKFLYNDEWVKDLVLEDYPGCRELTCILENLFRNKGLYFFIDDDNILITKGFTIKTTLSTDKTSPAIKPTGEISPTELQKTSEDEFVEIGNSDFRNTPGKVSISGYVTNTETGKREAGVTVFVTDLSVGTITSENGFYSLNIPRGKHELRFSFIGLQEKKVNLTIYESGKMNLFLNKSVVSLREIIVSAQKNQMLERNEAGVEKINVRTLSLLPVSFGEADVIKSINMIPGVQSVGEGSAGFNVRGGSADQNLILLYGAPVYNSSHFFGFFSAVNSDIIKDVTLYKGGIPSRYGGRISSVLDIESRDGNDKEFKGSAGISPVSTRLLLEGPIVKNKLSYLVTARTTYSNWIFTKINDTLLHDKKATFNDINLKIVYNLNNNNKLDVSSYFSHDYFRLNRNTIYSYNNNIQAFRWLHTFTSKFFSAVSLNNSYYGYKIMDQDYTEEAYFLSHNINSSQLRTDFNWSPGTHKFNFGIDATHYNILPGSYRPAGDSSLIIAKTIERERAFEGALYIEDRFNLTRLLSATAGFRISSFFSIGPQTVYEYFPGFSKTRLTITDTIHYQPGRITGSYAGPEFRVSLNYRVTPRNSIKVNYNRTRQYIHLLSNTASISPTDTWKLCGHYLKPETGDQYTIGFYRVFPGNSVEASAEVYYKDIRNMIDFRGGSTLTMIDNIEQYMVDVKGRAYGLELALKKTAGKTLFNLSYTYSRSELKSLSDYRDEIINSGNWYPANFDRPNNLVITYQLLYSRRFSFSADYTYSTGRPITIPIAYYSVNQIKMLHYSDRNKYRIPDYSRLDISFKISGNLKTHKIANPNLTFSVYNLLSKENAYSVYFKKVDQIVKGYKLSVFGRPIPTVTLNFDF